MDFAAMNWAAVFTGTIAAFAAGFVIYAPFAFGPVWARGTRVSPPERFPVGAMALQLLATFLLALVIGLTETAQALDAAVLVIFSGAALVAAGGAFAQKTAAAIMVDAGSVVVFGIVAIAAQAIM